MDEQEQTPSTAEKEAHTEALKENFSKPILPDACLQELVSLATTKHTSAGSAAISFPVIILTNGLMMSGNTVSYDTWMLNHHREMDDGFRKALEKLTGKPHREPRDLKPLERVLKETIEKNIPPRFIHLKNVRVLNDSRQIDLGERTLRIRLDAIDGWCLAVSD